MTTAESEKAIKIRTKVLGLFQPGSESADFSSVLQSVEKDMEDVSESDIRDVILRLIVSQRLKYMPDMRITLGK